jgi:hypothetical protein
VKYSLSPTTLHGVLTGFPVPQLFLKLLPFEKVAELGGFSELGALGGFASYYASDSDFTSEARKCASLSKVIAINPFMPG